MLRAALVRSAGRRRRQAELLSQRSGRNPTNWGNLGFAIFVLFMAIAHVLAGVSLHFAVKASQRAEALRSGKIVVSWVFLNLAAGEYGRWARGPGPSDYASEARRIAREEGVTREAAEQALRDSIRDHGARDLVLESEAAPGIRGLTLHGRLPSMMGSLVLLWWLVMMVFQGEGLELDTQRRRHPMWEWLFSHPVPAGAVFFADMLTPIAANPAYWGGPLFCGLVYGLAYNPAYGVLAGVFVGVPLTVSLACLGKAIEISVMLRLSARSRGAAIGLMSWIGYVSLLLFLVAPGIVPRLVTTLSPHLGPLAAVPWPWLGFFVGGRPDGTFLFPAGVLACLLFSVAVTSTSVGVSVWGAARGLSGSSGAGGPAPSAAPKRSLRFGKDPLYRRELVWFVRDRSAIVQCILIPLSLAGFQFFNMRGLSSLAQGAWNYLSGAAILFGTYFLWVLGPRSLLSEGNALWIAMTWPRGLESLLRAKARLWSILSTVMVAMVLGYAAFAFPGNLWQIALVGVGWFAFARSMAEKSVTLVTVTSASGEPEKIPWGRRAAAQLGTLTFAIGILTQQWHLAVIGIVYSWVTAAAMWQNFRTRLPYLYDPWSEELPPAPSLMHAMVAISVLIELAAVLSGSVAGIAGRQYAGVALAFGYAVSSIGVCIGTSEFLSNRNVGWRDVLRWPEATAGKADAGPDGLWSPISWRGFFLGAACGLGLGLLAHGYEAVLRLIPAVDELIRSSRNRMTTTPGLRLSYGVMAVAFAPFAEEYLFRGLLYRALDREWGGWRAVLVSAAFFAIYHQPLAWLPVFTVGAASALLFRKTGHLAPAIVLHMIYNGVVLFS